MPLTLTEVDTYPANVSVPSDGDTENAASVQTAFQALANRTKYLKSRVDALIEAVTAGAVYAEIASNGSGIAEGAKFPLTLVSQSGGFSIDAGENLVLPAGGGAAYLLLANFAFTHSSTASSTINFLPAIVDKGITTTWVEAPGPLHQNTDHPTQHMICSGSGIMTGVNPALDLFKLAMIVTNSGVAGTYSGGCNLIVRRIL